MKAAVYYQYGTPHVVTIKEIPAPSPKDNEVLIRIHASSVTTADWRARSLTMPRGFAVFAPLVFGYGKPRNPILGTELSGTIEAVGANVSKFKIGDEVIAATGFKYGTHAEYACLSEASNILLKPKAWSFEEAAIFSFGFLTAYDFLVLKAKLQKNETVLINGASGSVGCAAIQIAHALGAIVTAVCSTKNHDFVKSLGATNTIDYASEDFTQQSNRYDVILDPIGSCTYSNTSPLLNKNGRLLLVAADLAEMLKSVWISFGKSKKVFAGPASENIGVFTSALNFALKENLKPVIDKAFPLEQIVHAHQHVDGRHKRGNVVVKFI